MTISSESNTAGPFAGNGSTTSFPFAFKVFSRAELLLELTDVDGVVSTLVLDSDFSVSLNSDQDASPGGTITYPISGAPLATGETLIVSTDLPYTQLTDITNAGGFLPQVIEDALDRNVRLMQQQNERTARSVRAPLGEEMTNLPPAAERANMLLTFDASGNPIAVAPAAQSATALQTLLAGTGSGQGASKIGVQDSAGNWSATNVETVLTEVATRIGQIQVLVTEPRFAGGADPTGVADSTAAIQAAIDFVCAPTLANRGEVHFPAGTYKVSTLVLSYGVSLLGQYGRAVRLVTTTDAPVIRWSSSIPSYSRNITIKGFWMVGDGIASGKTSQTAIKIDHPWGHDGLTLQDLYIDGFNGYAIETAQQGSGATTNCFQFSQWSDIQIHNCGDGILMGVGFCGESEFHNVVIQVCTNTCITFSISGTGVGPQGLTFNTLVLGGAPIGLKFNAATVGAITFNNLHAENVPICAQTNSASLGSVLFNECWFVNFATYAFQGVSGGAVTFTNCVWSNTTLTPSNFIKLDATSNFVVTLAGSQTVSGNLPTDQILSTDINSVRGGFIRKSTTQGTIASTFQTYLGVQVRGIMSETATVRPNNLSGSTAIANGATTAAVTFSRTETDAAYRVIPTVSNGASSAVTWQPAISIGSKTTGGFTAYFSSAAPAAGWSIEWVLMR